MSRPSFFRLVFYWASIPFCVACTEPLMSIGGSGGSGVSGSTSSTGLEAGVGAGTAGRGGSGGGGHAAGSGPGAGGAAACSDGPLAAPLAGCTPAPLASTGDVHQDCVDRINQFRWECQCIRPLQRWTEGEACANDQAADDQATNSHSGSFGACGENAQNSCPNWGSETEVVTSCLQVMWDEGPGEPFQEHGHYINMSGLGFTKVACGFSTSPEGVWAYQNFAP